MKKTKIISNIKYALLILIAVWLPLIATTSVFADNAVKLKVLIISTGNETEDQGLAYIKPVLDEMGVPYDILNAATQNLTAEMLASSNGIACAAQDSGCVGNYNGIIITNADLAGNFTPSEWDLLHGYETDFHVRESVLSGWPASYWDAGPPAGFYLDYGLDLPITGASFTNTVWTVPAAYQKEVFEYVNSVNPLPVTDFAFAAFPRAAQNTQRDGTVPNVVPLLKTANGEALVSIVNYMHPSQATPMREVMISTITHASFLIHSNVLAYEFVNWATQGVFVGARFVHMTAHLDDLFLPDELWDIQLKGTNPNQTYRLNSIDIVNGVSKQNAFNAAYTTARNFKLDFPFNGAGAVVDPEAAIPVVNLTDDLVQAVVANKNSFRFINHTFTHADMDKVPVPANSSCDYETFTTAAAIQQEITKNRTVWGLLNLPEKAANNRVLVSGNHAGLKDRNCTDYPELHPEMFNVQDDDKAFDEGGANSLFLTAAANAGVLYLASDSSQQAQNIEQYISEYDDGSAADRLMLPRWPTNIFYNVIDPEHLVDEYNYIFHDRFVLATPPQDPCTAPGAICAPRTYPEILAAEADTALRHMLTFNKWPHYFHQTNMAKYDVDGNTLIFDWLGSVFIAYQQLLKLPVKNYPYYLIGDKTRDRLNAKSATIDATWDRTTNKVTVSANKAVQNFAVTGLAGGELYGGQFIKTFNIGTQPVAFTVNRALAQ